MPVAQAESKPTKPFIEALGDFLSMSKGRSQNEIISFFVQQIIRHSDVCEQGSVLRYVQPEGSAGDVGVFVVHDTDTNVNSDADPISKEAEVLVDGSIAGLAFKKRGSEYAPAASKHPQFEPIKGQSIGPLYCVSIQLPDLDEPFGVVAFHDPEDKQDFPPERLAQMNVAVQTLEAMLAQSPRRLMDRERVFIVHGRDERLREELQELLELEGIKPVVIQSLARTGQDLLAFLENKIRDCSAGFVLLTPDDEGRLYQFGEPMRQRARQNVIFEGGYLAALFRDTQRVCFLQHGDLEIPSDLNGLLMERFTDRIDKDRILLTLREWGVGHSAQRLTKQAVAGG